MIDRLLIEVEKRKRELEASIFKNPPPDMLDFNRRLGRWVELEQTADWCREVLRRQDQDEDEK